MNPTVFLTGCAQGIGRHLSEVFYRKNYNVVATDLAPMPHAEAWNENRCLVERFDVTNAADWERVMELTLTKFGTLDVLVNNAGVIVPGFAETLTVRDIDFQVAVNLSGVLYGSRLAAQVMARQGRGHLINVASLAGVAPIHGLAVYSATKAAVRHFTLAIAYDLRQRGVFASVVCPDLVNTAMLTQQLPHPAAALTFSGNRILTVQDVERAVFERALGRKELEILVPRSRGLLGKIGNFFPAFGQTLTASLVKKGLRQQARMNRNTDDTDRTDQHGSV
jgi:3-oxoacyl-[acyl-carrier protein] reductase